MTPRLKNILGIFVCVIFICISLEALVRMIHLAPYLPSRFLNRVQDEYLPYKPCPNSVVETWSYTGEYNYEFRHNSLGFRDTEHKIQKDEGVFRILGIGDSFTYGQGAPFDKTYLYLLEQELNNRPGQHPKVEIIKDGVVGFFQEPERILLEHYGLKYRPDLVIAAFVPNDVIDTDNGIEAVTTRDGYLISREGARMGKTAVWLYERSHVIRILLRGYVKYKAPDDPNNKRHNWEAIYVDKGPYEKDWLKIEEEYARMNDLASSVGAKLVIVNIPQNGIWDRSVFYPSYRLNKWCREHGAYFIDTLPAILKALASEQLYWKKDGHPNPRGYAVIAEAVNEGLKEKGLVP